MSVLRGKAAGWRDSNPRPTDYKNRNTYRAYTHAQKIKNAPRRYAGPWQDWWGFSGGGRSRVKAQRWRQLFASCVPSVTPDGETSGQMAKFGSGLSLIL
jgi:hypothetical protein